MLSGFRKIFFSVIHLLLLIIPQLRAQSWNEVVFSVTKEPQFSIVDFPTIIISEVIDDRGKVNAHTQDIYDQFSNAITGIDGLTLVDRSKTQELLKEFKFQQKSGLVDQDHIRQLGTFYGSGIIVFARIQLENFSNDVVSRNKLVVTNGCGIAKRSVAHYELVINVKIIDLQTAGILLSQNLTSKNILESKELDCKTPPKFRPEDIYPTCLMDIGTQFKNLFTYHKGYQQVVFQKNSKFNNELKQAITFFEIDEFNEGYNIIRKIPETMTNDKSKSSALYNLARLQYYTGDYDQCKENLKKAYILNPKNEDCLNLINVLK